MQALCFLKHSKRVSLPKEKSISGSCVGALLPIATPATLAATMHWTTVKATHIPSIDPSQSAAFLEEDELVVVEAESALPSGANTGYSVGSCADQGCWILENTAHGSDGSTFRGKGYLTWHGKNLFNSPGHGLLKYDIFISTPGVYVFGMHNFHSDPDSSESNDLFVKMDNLIAVEGSTQWEKVFSSKVSKWTMDSIYHHPKGEPEYGSVKWLLESGLHTLYISGRSEGFSFDRIHLHCNGKGARDPNFPESKRYQSSAIKVPSKARTELTNVLTTVLKTTVSVKPLTTKETPPITNNIGGKHSGLWVVQGASNLVWSAIASSSKPVLLSGNSAVFRTVTLTALGPQASEDGKVNPFTAILFTAIFTSPRGKKHSVPGYFAADGQAADSSASAGRQWRCHFRFPTAGDWDWTLHWKTREGSAIAGHPKRSGRIVVDARVVGRGLLTADGGRYLKFQNGDRWLKAGADSPENLLAFDDFDSTPPSHSYKPHTKDATAKTSPFQWANGKGRGLLGGLEYLSSKGVNSIYFLTMNVNGDGDDVWPWLSRSDRLRFDCSKLDQWERVFGAAEMLGIALHVVLQEEENDHLLDDGWMGETRKAYYRELVARFGHHNLVWNLGEENRNTPAQRKTHIAYLKQVDPYNHPIALHTFFTDMYGVDGLDIASVQAWQPGESYTMVSKFLSKSAMAGHPWVVMLDENGHWDTGAPPDAVDPEQASMRKSVLWPTLMAGGGGVEWYFGYSQPHNDLKLEDWRSRNRLWELTTRAVRFFETLPFWELEPCQGLVSGSALCMALSKSDVYVVYVPDASGPSVELDMSGSAHKTYNIRWFDPVASTPVSKLLIGSDKQVTGGRKQLLGKPPFQRKGSSDWVAVVERAGVGIVGSAAVISVSATLQETKSEPDTGSIKSVYLFAVSGVVAAVCTVVVVVMLIQRRQSPRRRESFESREFERDNVPSPSLCLHTVVSSHNELRATPAQASEVDTLPSSTVLTV